MNGRRCAFLLVARPVLGDKVSGLPASPESGQTYTIQMLLTAPRVFATTAPHGRRIKAEGALVLNDWAAPVHGALELR